MNTKGLIGAVKYSVLLGIIVLAIFLIAMPGFAAPEAGSPIFVEITNESIASGGQYAPLINYGFEINQTNTTENSPGNCTLTTNFSGSFANYTTATTIAVTEVIDATNNKTNCYINFTQNKFDGAKTYYYEWFVNGSADGTWNQTSNVTYSIAQNTSIYPQITNSSVINKTHTTNWFWANLTTDLDSGSSTDNTDTFWCGASMNNTENYTLTNSTGNWNKNISAISDGSHNITFYCNNTNTNYTINTNQSEVYNLTFGATVPVLSDGSASGYLTSSSATISVTTNENAVCRYSTTAGRAYGLMDSATQTASGISHSWTVIASAYTTYNYYIRCNDTYGTVNTVDYPINFTKTASTSNPGGPGSPAPEQTVEITEIDAGESKTMTFTDQDLDVTTVVIKAENDMSNVALKITKLSSLPSNVDDPTGVVYNYLNFAETRMDEGDIDNAKIRFRVTKSWIEFNEIDPDTIVMKRWNDDKWERLTTKELSDDSTYYNYEAITSGFSYFVVSGETIVVEDDTVYDTGDDEETPTQDNTWLWVIVVLVIVGVGGYYYYENIYKKKTPWKSLHKRWRK